MIEHVEVVNYPPHQIGCKKLFKITSESKYATKTTYQSYRSPILVSYKDEHNEAYYIYNPNTWEKITSTTARHLNHLFKTEIPKEVSEYLANYVEQNLHRKTSKLTPSQLIKRIFFEILEPKNRPHIQAFKVNVNEDKSLNSCFMIKCYLLGK